MMDHGGEVPPTLMESTEDSLKESEELLRSGTCMTEEGLDTLLHLDL